MTKLFIYTFTFMVSCTSYMPKTLFIVQKSTWPQTRIYRYLSLNFPQTFKFVIISHSSNLACLTQTSLSLGRIPRIIYESFLSYSISPCPPVSLPYIPLFSSVLQLELYSLQRYVKHLTPSICKCEVIWGKRSMKM